MNWDIIKIDFLPNMSEIIPLGTSTRITVIANTLIINDRFVSVAPWLKQISDINGTVSPFENAERK